MALSVRKKSSYIFSPPSYIKKSGLENKVDKIINDTIEEKLFNRLNINKRIYVKLIEYFETYTLNKFSNEKEISSFMLKIKTKPFGYSKISAREIELSGINLSEFTNFLEVNGAKRIKNIGLVLNKI